MDNIEVQETAAEIATSTVEENSNSTVLEDSFDSQDVEDEAAEVPPMPFHQIEYIESYDTYIVGPGRNHPITVSLTRFTCSACGGKMGKRSP